MEFQGQKEFVTIHKWRDQLEEFYHSLLGQAFLAYLSSEARNAMDELVMKNQDPIKEGVLKGKAQAFYGIVNLATYLKSVELKKPEEKYTEQ